MTEEAESKRFSGKMILNVLAVSIGVVALVGALIGRADEATIIVFALLGLEWLVAVRLEVVARKYLWAAVLSFVFALFLLWAREAHAEPYCIPEGFCGVCHTTIPCEGGGSQGVFCTCAADYWLTCLPETECVGRTPTPVPTATPAPSPTPTHVPRMSQDAKNTLLIAVDAADYTRKALPVLSAVLIASGQPLDALFAQALAMAMGEAVPKIKKMVEKDPPRDDWQLLAWPAPKRVPDEIRGQLRRDYIRTLYSEIAVVDAAIITLDRIGGAVRDGNAEWEANQQGHLDYLLHKLGRLLAHDADLQITVVRRWPEFASALAQPNYIEALRTAAATLNP